MSEFTEQQWSDLHEEIQQRFRALAAELQRAAPSVEAAFGKTVTKLFPLFSHVSFGVAKRGDIIVGVDIAPQDGHWRIDADVCHEEDGTIYFELPNTPFAVASFAELRGRVLEAVDQLLVGGKPVLLGLFAAAMPTAVNGIANVSELARKR